MTSDEGRMVVALLLEQLRARVPGGVGRYSRDLAEALLAAAPSGGRVEGWVARARGAHDPWIAGVEGPRELAVGRVLLSRLWERGVGPTPRPADLVHAPSLLMPPRHGVPLVVTIHDSVPWTHPETLTDRGAAFHRRMGRRAVREADVVVVPTRAVATQLGSLVPGFDGCRVEVVANGLSPRWGGLLSGPGVDDGVRARSLALPEDGYWLFVGTLEPRKGIDVLLRALARSPAEVPLLVVGPAGWGGVDIEEQSRLVGLRPGMVRIMGRVSDEDLAVLYRGATALVVPSGAEGYGYPVLEGMAAGTAVVTSDDAALKETGGGVPLTFPVGDDQELAAVLGRLATDSSLRAALGRRGRASAAGRTTIEAALRLWDIYRSLV